MLIQRALKHSSIVETKVLMSSMAHYAMNELYLPTSRLLPQFPHQKFIRESSVRTSPPCASAGNTKMLRSTFSFPTEIFLAIKHAIHPYDLRTHVCFYLSSREIAGLYDVEQDPDGFWELACWHCGLGMLPSDEESRRPWKDVAIECIKRDGFCTLPWCGESMLCFNRERRILRAYVSRSADTCVCGRMEHDPGRAASRPRTTGSLPRRRSRSHSQHTSRTGDNQVCNESGSSVERRFVLAWRVVPWGCENCARNTSFIVSELRNVCAYCEVDATTYRGTSTIEPCTIAGERDHGL